MTKIKIIFKCFGTKGAIKYIYYKMLTLLLKKIFSITGRKSTIIASIIKKYVFITDSMVQNYIYSKYNAIYCKYSSSNEIGIVPDQKIIWTCWLQGVDNLPEAVQRSVDSMKRHSGKYKVIVLTLENLNNYLHINEEILEKYSNRDVSAAHLSDYIRVKVLKIYGGVWMDATQYMIKEIPDTVWAYPLLVWNKVNDLTHQNAYVAIPFVENFNNSFLVGKINSTFYCFATEITEALLLDDILKIDYFANFKAYFKAVEEIPSLETMWKQMNPINPYGLLTRQFWNKPISHELKEYIHSEESLFFMLTYKKNWEKRVKNISTVQEYIVEEL